MKQTALLFTVVYLFSTGSIMIRSEEHALHHEEHAGHAKRHASFICAWMCAASAFVHTSAQTLDRQSAPLSKNPIADTEALLRMRPVSSETIRPPPSFSRS